MYVLVNQRLMLKTTQEALPRYKVRPLMSLPSWVGMCFGLYQASTLLSGACHKLMGYFLCKAFHAVDGQSVTLTSDLRAPSHHKTPPTLKPAVPIG